MIDIMSEEYETMIKEMKEGKEVVITPWGRAKINTGGHYRITSVKEGFYKMYVHVLIWEAFYERKRPNDYDIHHVDSNKLNNAIQNLQCVEHSKHMSFHNKGKEAWNKDKNLSKEHKQNLSKNHADFSGKNNPRWKNYARITKKSSKNNKPNYVIRYKGKIIKSSFYIHKLYKWWGTNYPDEYLYLEVN